MNSCMEQRHGQGKNQNRLDVIFNWRKFVRFLMETPDAQKQIGPAWRLFMDICQNADQSAMYSTTYDCLAKRYEAPSITIKRWRRRLYQQSVIESFSRGHCVVFRLLPPFSSFVKIYQQNHKPYLKEAVLQKLFQALKDQTFSEEGID